ncbi:MAG: fibronectin type III domain-containing protein, partial [Actinomycetota bacterium]
WSPATRDPIDHLACSGDNTGSPPFVNANDTSNPTNPYNDPNPVRCQIVLTKLRNQNNTSDVPLPFADPATNVRWFRIRAIFPHKLKVPGGGNNNVEFPAAVRGILHSPWSGIDPAILGPIPPANVQAFPSFPSITLTWINAAAGDPAFQENIVERTKGITATVVRVPSSTAVYLDGPLDFDSVYQYRIVAVRKVNIFKPGDPNTGSDPDPGHIEEGVSASHNAGAGLTIITPPVPAPGDPTNLIATFSAPSTANLFWIDNSTDEDGFLIEFGPDGITWAAQTAVGPHNSPPTGPMTAMQVAIPPDTVRFYRVFAYRVSPLARSNPSNTAMIIAVPKAPSNLVETSVTSFQSVLQWKDNSRQETAFRVEFCDPAIFTCPPTGVTGWATAGVVISPTPSTVGETFTFTDGRFGSTTLKYRVIAFNTSGDSVPSNVISSTTPASPLSTPLNLAATATGPHAIQVTWSDTPDDNGYRLEFSDTGTIGPFTTLATVGANVTSYIDAPLSGGKTRCYRVRSIDPVTGRRSNPSNVDCETTPMGPIPNAPSGLVAVPWSVNPTMAVEMTWFDNSSNEDGFIVEHSNNLQTWRVVARTASNVSVLRIGNYDPNSVQYFRVKAFNFEGESAYSNIAQVLLLGPPRPVWLNPSRDGQVATSACYVDGRFTLGFSPPINDIQITIVRKLGLDTGTYQCNSTPGSCTNSGGIVPIHGEPPSNQVQLNWNGAGTFRLEYHFLKNITYELHARAVNAHGASADAFIATFAVLADCPLG